MNHAGSHVILLVEDNPDDIFFIETILKKRNSRNQLFVVRDGMEALNFLRREGSHVGAPRPHLIILDLHLPRLSGVEVLRTAKADPSLRRIPVIVLTQSDLPEDVRACYDLFVTSYVTKPSSIDEYASVMDKIERFWLETVKLPS